MDTPVSFEIAKLLKEKGFDIPTFYYYEDEKLVEPYLENGSSTDVEFRVDLSDLKEHFNKWSKKISAPTIIEVIMWMYKKHEIWTEVYPREFKELNLMWSYTLTKIESTYTINGIEFPDIEKPDDIPTWKSLTEAYEAAINYILNNLI